MNRKECAKELRTVRKLLRTAKNADAIKEAEQWLGILRNKAIILRSKKPFRHPNSQADGFFRV